MSLLFVEAFLILHHKYNTISSYNNIMCSVVIILGTSTVYASTDNGSKFTSRLILGNVAL